MRRVALIAVMALGSVLMWIGMPVLWLWIASQLAEGSSASMGPYLLVVVAVPASMAAIAKGLGALDRAYARITDTQPQRRVRLPWLESLRGERDVARRWTVLDVVMVASVSIAGVAFAVWFLFFAGSSLPGA